MSDDRKNFFQVFSIPQEFDLDEQQLKQIYQQQQAKVHPDRFVGSTEAEKLRSIQATSLLNQAFETLSSPQLRAAYLLQLEGIDVDSVSQADLSPALLMQQMELREQLEHIVNSGEPLDKLASLRGEIERLLKIAQQSFAEKMKAGDYEEARSSYFEMQYLGKLLTEIDTAEEKILDY